MNAIYVSAKAPETSCWVGSVIAAKRAPMSMPLAQFERAWVQGWVRIEGVPQEIRYREYLFSCFEEREGTDVDDSEDVVHDELIRAMAATNVIEIDTRLRLSAPFWVSDQRDWSDFEQPVLVRLDVRLLSECPDVQAYLNETEELDTGIGDLLSMAGRPDNGRAPPRKSPWPARRRAEQTPIEEGMLLACETKTSKTLLRLGSAVGRHVYKAVAKVCGISPLAKADTLCRCVSGPRGDKWEAVIGEVIEEWGT